MATSLDEVLEAFAALLEERAQVPRDRDTDRSNFRCERCEGCSHCRFCTDCTDCDDCTYCTGCDECSGCTHCDDCQRCAQTTHSRWSSGCKDCSYVTLCLDCASCVQCFACVGLRNEEFCILNEKLPRKTYFSRVAELRSAFERKVAEGWLPPWQADPEDDEDEPEPEPEVAASPLDEPAPARPHEPEEPEPHAIATVGEPSAADSSTSLRLEALWASEMPEASPVVDPGSGPIVFTPRSDANVDTIDTGEPADSRPRQSTPMWSFSDVGRRRRPAREEPDLIPEPPPFGAADEPRMSRSTPRMRSSNDEPRDRRREPTEPTRDRYGWSAQTEGTPASPGWTASAHGPERQPATEIPSADSPARPQRWDEPTVDRLPPRAPWDLERAASRSRWHAKPDDDRPAHAHRSTGLDPERPPSRRDTDLGPERPPSRRSTEPERERPSAQARWKARTEDTGVTGRPAWDEQVEPSRPSRRDRWDHEQSAERPASRPGWGQEETPHSLTRTRWDDQGPPPAKPAQQRWDDPQAPPTKPRQRWSADPDLDRPASRLRWHADADADAQGQPEPRRHVPTPRVEAPPEREWNASPGHDREPLPRWESSERDQETRPSKPRRDDDLPVQGWSLDKLPRTRSSARTSEVPAMPAVPPLSSRPPASTERPESWSGSASPRDLDPRRRESVVSLEHRRRETAATPSAPLRDASRPERDVSRPERSTGPITDFIQRDLDQWLPYDEARSPALGPDEQTEPDAPVVRRGAARPEISSSARATSARGDSEWPEDRRPGSRPHPKNSLGLARRPERPRNPEPRERGALLRGRAPTRPNAAAPGPRQSDAPSLRHARRPARSREETTSKFSAARLDGEPDPGSGS